MPSLRSHAAKLALKHPELRDQIVPLLKDAAAPWSHLPKGWDEDSVRKFWDTMTGDVKHKVTKCIKEMGGSNITDPGAFCASLADKMEPGWRSKKAARSLNVANTPLAKAREYATEVFAKAGQDIDEVLPDFDRHYLLLQKKVQRAPSIPRIKMPVIEPSDMDLFNKRLNEGKLDVFKPYAKGKLVKPKDSSLEPGEEWVELGVKDGNPTDDIIRGKKSKSKVVKLLPTQSEIWLENLIPNIVKFGKAGSGSPILKAPLIVSMEGYILDGHHRFGQAMMADPGLAMSSLYIPLDIDTLLEIGRDYGEAIGNKPKQAAAPPGAIKATFYFKGALGISKVEGHLTSVDANSAGGMVNYIPKGGRRERGLMTYYSPFIMVVEGWGKPDPEDAFEAAQPGLTPGVEVSKGRYMSHDPRWVSDFIELVGKRMRPIVLFEDGKLKKIDSKVTKNASGEANLRTALIKLAYNHPELRPKLLPLIKS